MTNRNKRTSAQSRPSTRSTRSAQRTSKSTRNRTSAQKATATSKRAHAKNSNRKSTQPKATRSIAQMNMGESVWGASNQAGRSKSRSTGSRRQASSASGSAKAVTQQAPGGAVGVLATVGGAVGHGVSKAAQAFVSVIRTSPRARIVLAVVAVLLVLWIGDTVANGGRVYGGVRVGSVDVGGMTVQEARDAIDEHYTPMLMGNSVVIYDSQASKDAGVVQDKNTDSTSASTVDDFSEHATHWVVNGNTLQARIDATQLAQDAYEVGRADGGLLTRIGNMISGTKHDVVAQFNSEAVEALAHEIDLSIGDPMVNSSIKVSNGKAESTAGHDGNQVNRSWFLSMLNNEFFADDNDTDRSFIATAEYTPMQINEDQAKGVSQKVNDAISNPVTFNFQSNSWTASGVQLGSWVKTDIQSNNDGSFTLVPSFDANIAKQDILKNLQAAFSGENANTVTFTKSSSGSVLVHVDAKGTMPKVQDAVKQLNEQAFNGNGTSTIEVQGQDIPEVLSVDAASEYGIISCFSEYTTEYTSGAEARNNNIHRAADLLNDSIVTANGGVWSFNETAGECNEEKGFQGAGSIVEGEYVDEIGGGICQVATTVFNCVYDSGLPITQRRNHSLYVATYPAGRDSAINWPDLDLKWKNDGSSDVLLRMSYTDTSVTAKLYGINPGYTVKTIVGDWEDGEKYGVVTKYDNTLPEGTSYTKSPGSDGKSITIERQVFNQNGTMIIDDLFESNYDAKDEIVVKGGTEQ